MYRISYIIQFHRPLIDDTPGMTCLKASSLTSEQSTQLLTHLLVVVVCEIGSFTTDGTGAGNAWEVVMTVLLLVVVMVLFTSGRDLVGAADVTRTTDVVIVMLLLLTTGEGFFSTIDRNIIIKW